MADTRPSSEQRADSPLLAPVKFKVTATEDAHVKKQITQYELKGRPESLNRFLDLFFTNSSAYDYFRYIWVTDCSFVRLRTDGIFTFTSPQNYKTPHFQVFLHRGSSVQCLSIYASKLADAKHCLNFLCGLPNNHYQCLHVTHSLSSTRDVYPPCPIGIYQLKKFLGNRGEQQQQHGFSFMSFRPEECRILAESSFRLGDCKFLDEGRSFLEVFTERQGTAQTNIAIEARLPFNQECWILFLDKLKETDQKLLKSLSLCGIELNQESCRALAEAEIQHLALLGGCELEDQGAALIESVIARRGARELCLEDPSGWKPFQTQERWESFINALRGNNRLKHLRIGMLDADEVLEVLADALPENQGLVHLSIHDPLIGTSCWSKVVCAISRHPSLRTLNFDVSSEEESDEENYVSGEEAKRERTRDVANMLSVNQHVEEIRFYDSTFNRPEWDSDVVPRLECNIYRKKFPSIQKIEMASTRAAVLGAAMARVSNAPSLLWMLLSKNQDTVVSRIEILSLREIQGSICSRKRGHSP
jgi:hypothetical protein